MSPVLRREGPVSTQSQEAGARPAGPSGRCSLSERPRPRRKQRMQRPLPGLLPSTPGLSLGLTQLMAQQGAFSGAWSRRYRQR